MSKKVKIKLNRAGVREIMKSQEMQNILAEHATEIQARCGNGYANDLHLGKRRANAMIWADSNQAKRDNKKNNTILKAVRG